MSTLFSDEDIVNRMREISQAAEPTEPAKPSAPSLTPPSLTPLSVLPKTASQRMSLEEEKALMEMQYGKAQSSIKAAIGPLRKLYAGFKSGVYSELDTMDKVADVISSVTGVDKGGAFKRLKEYVQPTEEEMPTPEEGLGSKVLRGIGAAIPIIAEFSLGTKGMGYLMGKAGLPTAIKLGARIPGMAAKGAPAGLSRLIGAGQAIPAGTKGVVGLAAPTYFGAREALGGALEAPTGEKTTGALKGLARGLTLGGGLEAAGMIPSVGKIPGAALRVPAVSALFGGQAAVAGEEPIPSAIVGAVLAGVPELTRINTELKAIKQPKAIPVTPPTEPGVGAPGVPGEPGVQPTVSTKTMASALMKERLINQGLSREVADQLDYDLLKSLTDSPLTSYADVTYDPIKHELVAPGKRPSKTGKRKQVIEKTTDENLQKIVADEKIADESLKQDAATEIKSRVQKRQAKTQKIEETLPVAEANQAPTTDQALTQNRAKFQTLAQELMEEYAQVKDKKLGRKVYKVSPEAIIRKSKDYNIAKEDLPGMLAYLRANDILVADIKQLGISETAIKERMQEIIGEQGAKERIVSKEEPIYPTEQMTKEGAKMTSEEAKAAWDQAKTLLKSRDYADTLKAQGLREKVYSYLGWTGPTLPKDLDEISRDAKIEQMLENKARMPKGKQKLVVKEKPIVPEPEKNKPEVLAKLDELQAKELATMKKEGKKMPAEVVADNAIIARAVTDGKFTREEFDKLEPREKELVISQINDLYELEGAIKEKSTDPKARETIETLQEDYYNTLDEMEFVLKPKPKGKAELETREDNLKQMEDLYGITEMKEVSGEKVEGKAKMQKMREFARSNLGWSDKSLKTITDEKVMYSALKEKKTPEDYEILNGQFIKKSAEQAVKSEQDRMKELAKAQGIEEDSDVWNQMFPEKPEVKTKVQKVEDLPEIAPEDLIEKFDKLGSKSDAEAKARDEVNPDDLANKAINRSLAEAAVLKELSARQQSLINEFDSRLADLTSLSQRIRKAKNETVRNALIDERNAIDEKVKALVNDMDAIFTATRPQKSKGPLAPGEISLETNIINKDGVPVGTIVSQGIVKGGKFYVVKSATGGEVGNVPGHVIVGNAEVRLRTGRDGKRLELKVFDVTNKDPDIEDALLSNIINKYATGENPQRVEQVKGIADQVWDRRKDISYESLTDKKNADMDSLSKANTELLATVRRLEYNQAEQKTLELSVNERQDALIEATKIGADAEKMADYFKEPVSLQPQRSDMVPWLERYADPSQSTNPVLRAIGNLGVQFELQNKQLVSKYLRYRDEALGWMRGDPDIQHTFFKHLYDIERSHDPKILEAEQAWRFIHDSIARMFRLEERGLYLKKYATFIYDMNKIWEFFGRPLDVAKSYIELPDSVISKLAPEWFNQMKEIRTKYPVWDTMPPNLQQFVQLKYLNWGAGYSKWIYLPEVVKAVLPEHKFNAYFQQRTAGDRLKFALNEDVFDTSTMYILSTMRNGLLTDFFLPRANALARRLPFSGVKGTYRNMADEYIKMMSGFGRRSTLDNSWNSFANFINTRFFHKDAIPLYVPKEAAGLYSEALYRGAIGPDTAVRNLTQSIYTFADVGGKNFLKGFLRYVDGWWNKTPEYLKFKEHLSIGDEFFHEHLQSMRRSDPSNYEKFKYYSQRLTNLVLSPMQITEHINKGIAYFAGLEEAAAKGYDFSTAHVIGLRRAGEVIPSLEYSEAQWYALNKSMYGSQFGYSPAHMSPYLQGTGMRFLKPFWSFPVKTAQFLQKGFKEGWWEHISGDNSKLIRFMALTGFMAAAPQLLVETVGIDSYSLWGKGILPAVVAPAFLNFMKDAWTAVGLDDKAGVFDKEAAKNNVKNTALLFTIPQWRWLKKGALSLESLDKAHTTWGRAESPLTETTFFNEFLTLFGWPPVNRREAREYLKDYKDMRSEKIIKKQEAIMDIIEHQESGNYRKAVDILNNARKEGIIITAHDVNQMRARRETDAFELQYKALPKDMRTPELQRKFREAQQKFLGGQRKYRGTRPLWISKWASKPISSMIEAVEE